MIFHRTIIKELATNLAVIVFSMSVLLFMEKFVRLTRLFMGKGADLIDVAKIFIYLQPSILLLSVPMAILISIFLTYGRMSTDSETVVLKASGMSFWGISRPAVTLSVICLLALLFTSLYLLPASMHAFKYTVHQTIVKKASMTLEEESFTDVFKGTVIYIKKIVSENKFRGIFIYRDADSKMGGKPIAIAAESGVIHSDPEEGLIKLTMNDGLIHTFDKKSSSEISFTEYDFILTSGIEADNKTKPEEVNTIALWKGRKDDVAWEIELNRRFALPFACIIFGFLGPALSNKIGKTGRLGGFSMSLAILILYYMLLVMAEGLAKSNEIPPFWGGWSPNIVFGAITCFFTYFAYQDKPIKRL